MTSYKGFCMRCPTDTDAEQCSSNGDKMETLIKCKAGADNVWRDFRDDSTSDPPALFPDTDKCKFFLVTIYDANRKYIKTLKKNQSDEHNLKGIAEWKARHTFKIDDTHVPVTKEMLEYTYSQYVADLPTGKGKGKEKEASNKNVPASSSTASKAISKKEISENTAPEKSHEIPQHSTPNQIFTAATHEVLHEQLSELAGLKITQTGPSTDKTTDSSSGQNSLPFGSFLNSHATATQYGTTHSDKLSVLPPWSCSSPAAYQQKAAPAPFDQAIHLTAPFNARKDIVDDERSGKGGTKIDVVTNYLQVTQVPKQVYEYSLVYGAFTQNSNATGGGAAAAGPRNVTQRAQKEQVFKALRNMDPLHGNEDWATDYVTVWSLRPLRDPTQSAPGVREPTTGESFTTQRVDFHKFSGKPSQITGVTFCFTRKLEFSTNNLKDLVSSGGRDDNGASIHTTALNALLSSKVIASNNAAISTGPNKFYAKHDYNAFLGIQAHRGYFTSIRPGTHDILLNISTMTGAFYEPLKVSRFMTEMGSPKFSEYGGSLHLRHEKLLVGRSVRILYDRASYEASYDANLDVNRHRIIVEIGKPPSQQRFGEKPHDMSVRDYFVNKLRARPPPSDEFGCVNVGVKLKSGDPKTKGKQIWIPAEYVALDPDQPFARRLASPHMEKIHSVSLLSPAATQDKIVRNGFNLLGLNNPATFGKLDLKIVPGLLLIPARSLPEPALLYRRPKGGFEGRNSRLASWNLRDVHFFRPASTETPVSAINFRQSLRGGVRDFFAKDVAAAMASLGMVVPATTASRYWWSGSLNSGRVLAKNFTDGGLAALMQPRRPANIPGLHVVILEDTDSDSYATVKRVFDQHVGSHTVCITAAKLPRNDSNGAQLLANLCLKFNLKLGGINHLPAVRGNKNKVSIFPGLLRNDTMVIGADVSHAPSQMDHCPSVAAVVASDDHQYANFPGSMRLQASKQEFLQDLRGMVVERLWRYVNVNHHLPTKVVFFRDGVGEDMYDRVRDAEIPQIKSAYEQVRQKGLSNRLISESKAGFHLTFIVVGKRHHTRFFCKEAAQGDDKGNVKPGLIVDRVITRPKLSKDDQTFDFFLQSHQALKGTARSGHYVVLQKGAFDVTQIQSFTHAFCYNYARATKGVSYAGPAYYADRLAERGTLYLKAYTNGKTKPAIAMNKEETDHGDKREGERMFERRVAQHIQGSPEWNPRLNTPVGAAPRINPWHPYLDDCMFWL